jgi:hypothetical protein
MVGEVCTGEGKTTMIHSERVEMKKIRHQIAEK